MAKKQNKTTPAPEPQGQESAVETPGQAATPPVEIEFGQLQEENEGLKSQLAAMQKQLEESSKAVERKPPSGPAKRYRVTARHSPLPKKVKSLEVTARDETEAFEQFEKAVKERLQGDDKEKRVFDDFMRRKHESELSAVPV